MSNPFKKSSKYEILETQNFSCNGMTGFTFKYPVFKNWEEIKIEQSITREIIKEGSDLFLKDPNHCIITITWSGFAEIPPMAPLDIKEPIKPPPIYVEVKKESRVDPRIHGNISKNPATVEFYQTNNAVTFIVGDSLITVLFLLQNVYEIEGFSKEQFLKTIIESFKLTNNSVADYKKVTLQQIELGKEKLDGEKVEYTGEYESAFEVSLLDVKIWLESSPSYIQDSDELPTLHKSYYHAKITVWGTLLSKKDGRYGHLGMRSYQINADKIKLLEKLTIHKELAISIARQDAEKIYKDLSLYNVVTSLEENGWHVDYEPKILEMVGGGPHYIIDSKTGKIISKIYEKYIYKITRRYRTNS